MEDNLHQTIFTIPNIQLDSIKAVSFDPVNDSIITVANNKLNVQEVSSDTPDVFNIPQALSSSEANKAKMDRSSQFDRLRFLPVHSTKKMSVTHFGNVVTSYGKNPQTAIANYGFSHGTHYWEMICPNKCAGIEVGVTNNQSITEDVSNGTKFVLFEFNTSTARIICIQMDLANMEVSAWLKGNEGKKKKSSVERGTWYPCVKINELGNVAVLNTRINDDKISKKSEVRKFIAKSQIKKALSLCAVTLEKESSLKTDNKRNFRAFTFHTDEELYQFDKSLGTNITLMNPQHIKTWGYQIAKKQKPKKDEDPDLSAVQDWLHDNVFKIAQAYKPKETEKSSLLTKLKNLVNEFENVEERKTDTDKLTEENPEIQVQYIKASDSLLVTKGDLMKIVTRTNGEFNAIDILSFNRPCSPRDNIQIFFELKPLQILLRKISASPNSIEICQDYTGLWGLEKLLEAIHTSFEKEQVYSEYLLVNVPYKFAKRGIDVLVNFIENSLQKLNATDDLRENKDENLSEDELNLLLNSIARVDEALFAMIHHEDASSKLFAYWQSANSRVFTSFNRIETLMSLPDSQFDIVKLADLGLLNKSYLSPDFKHFQNEELLIDSDKILKESPPQIESLLKKHVNMSTKNVPLSITLNNLPPELRKQDLKFFSVSNEAPFVVGVTEEGEVSIWNANQAFVFLCKHNFKLEVQESMKFFGTEKSVTQPLDPFQPLPPSNFGFGNPFQAAPVGGVFGGGGFGGGGFGGFGGFGGGLIGAPVNPIVPSKEFKEPEELEEDPALIAAVKLNNQPFHNGGLDNNSAMFGFAPLTNANQQFGNEMVLNMNNVDLAEIMSEIDEKSYGLEEIVEIEDTIDPMEEVDEVVVKQPQQPKVEFNMDAIKKVLGDGSLPIPNVGSNNNPPVPFEVIAQQFLQYPPPKDPPSLFNFQQISKPQLLPTNPIGSNNNTQIFNNNPFGTLSASSQSLLPVNNTLGSSSQKFNNLTPIIPNQGSLNQPLSLINTPSESKEDQVLGTEEETEKLQEESQPKLQGSLPSNLGSFGALGGFGGPVQLNQPLPMMSLPPLTTSPFGSVANSGSVFGTNLVTPQAASKFMNNNNNPFATTSGPLASSQSLLPVNTLGSTSQIFNNLTPLIPNQGSLSQPLPSTNNPSESKEDQAIETEEKTEKLQEESKPQLQGSFTSNLTQVQKPGSFGVLGGPVQLSQPKPMMILPPLTTSPFGNVANSGSVFGTNLVTPQAASKFMNNNNNPFATMSGPLASSQPLLPVNYPLGSSSQNFNNLTPLIPNQGSFSQPILLANNPNESKEGQFKETKEKAELKVNKKTGKGKAGVTPSISSLNNQGPSLSSTSSVFNFSNTFGGPQPTPSSSLYQPIIGNISTTGTTTLYLPNKINFGSSTQTNTSVPNKFSNTGGPLQSLQQPGAATSTQNFKPVSISISNFSSELQQPLTQESSLGTQGQKLPMQGAKVCGTVIVPMNTTPLCPLIVGVCFQRGNSCMLKLRRFAYSPSYIHKFFYKDESNNLFSLLNSEYFEMDDYKRIQNHLGKDYKLTFSTLEPLLFGRNRYRNGSQTGKFFQTEWVPLYGSQLELPFTNLLGISLLPPQELKEDGPETRKLVAIGTQSSSVTICYIDIVDKYEFCLHGSQIPTFVANVSEKKVLINLDFDKDVKIIPVKDRLFLFQTGKEHVLVLNDKLIIEKRLPLAFEIKDAKALDNEKIVILDTSGISHILDFGDKKSVTKTDKYSQPKLIQDELNQNPEQYLDELLNVLSDTVPEKLCAQNIPIYELPFSKSIKTKSGEKYNKITFEVLFTQKSSLKKQKENSKDSEQENEWTVVTENEDRSFPLSSKVPTEASNLKYLPIIPHKVKGGAFNQFLPAACMTTPSVETFVSKYSNTEFIFRHLHDKNMLIDSITLSAPLKSSGLNGYPIKSGFVYISSDLTFLSSLKSPNVKTIKEFQDWHSQKIMTQARFKENEPVGFFRLDDGNETQSFEILEKRAGKFVLLKPIELRQGEQSFSAKDHPIEIGFFGVHGFALNQKDLVPVPGKTDTLDYENIPFNVMIEAKVSQQWVEIFNVSEIKLEVFKEKVSAQFDVQHDILEKGQAKELKITLSPSLQKPNWNILAVHIQPTIKDQATSLKDIDVKALKQDLIFTDKYKNLLQSLATSMCSQDRSHNDRNKIAQILHVVLSRNSSMKGSILAHIDLEQFVILNILSETQAGSFSFLSLLRGFTPLESFKSKLSNVLYNLLPRLTQDVSFTAIGLRTYFALLGWTSSDSSRIPSVMQMLKDLCKKVKELRDPTYLILRSQYNISSLPFEKSLFDENFILPITENSPEPVSSAKNPIQSKVLHHYLLEGDSFLIDLQGTYDISHLQLLFPSQNNLTHLRISIWGITQTKKELKYSQLASKYYNDTEGVWMHLTQNSHKTALQKYFIDPEELSRLGLDINTRVRYLKVQVTYSFRAGLPNVNKERAKSVILPLVYGQRVEIDNDNIKDLDVELERNFNTKDNSKAKKKQLVTVNPWFSYVKLQGKTIHSVPCFLYQYEIKNSTEGNGNDGTTSVEKDLEVELIGMQTQLYEELYQKKHLESSFKDSKLVAELCEKIQNIQINLYNQPNGKKAQRLAEGMSSLPILLSLIQNVSGFILDILRFDSNRITLNVQDIKEIFDAVFIYESPSFTQSLYRLIKDIVLPLLNSNEKKAFLNLVYGSYLVSDDSTLTESTENLYSTSSVVNFFVQIISKDIESLNFFLEKVGETKSLMVNIYSLIIINEFYLSLSSDKVSSGESKRINGLVLETLVRNLEAVIDEEELQETDKQYLVGLIVDIILNVLKVSNYDNMSHLYKNSNGLLRVIYYICKNKYNILIQKLMDILNNSCDIFIGEHSATSEQRDTARIGLLLANLDKPYVKFIFETLQGLLEFPLNDLGTKEHPVVKHFTEENELEWKEITELFVMHLYTILGCDRKSKYLQQKTKVNKEDFYACPTKFGDEDDKDSQPKDEKEEEKSNEKPKEEGTEKKDGENDIQIDEKTQEIEEESDLEEEVEEDFESSKIANLNEMGILDFGNLRFRLTGPLEDNKDFQTLSLVILDLVNLLSNNSKRKRLNFSENPRVWKVIVDIISMFELSENLNEKIIPGLLQSFFEAPKEIKDYIYAPFVCLFSSYKTLSLDVVTQLVNFSAEVMFMNQSPNENKEDENLNNFMNFIFKHISQTVIKQGNISYNEDLIKTIIKTSEYLFKSIFNLGGGKTLMAYSKAQICQYKHACSFISLIDTTKEGEISHPFSLIKFFENYANNKEIANSLINTLIRWYMFNKSNVKPVLYNPSEIKYVFNQFAKKVFKTVLTNEDITKFALKSLLENFSNTLNSLSEVVCQRTITAYHSVDYIDKICSTFKELMEMWMTSEKAVEYFIREIKGFEYLLKVLELKDLDTKPISMISKQNELSRYFTNRSSRLNSENYHLMELYKDAQKQVEKKEKDEEDFASNVKIHRLPGQNWTQYSFNLGKTSMKPIFNAKKLSFEMTGEEYVLCLEFDKAFDIQKMKIFFQQTFIPDIVTSKLSIQPDVFIEAGTSLTNLSYVGKMEKSKIGPELANLLYSFEGFNNTGDNSDQPKDWLKSINNLQVKFMKLIFKRHLILTEFDPKGNHIFQEKDLPVKGINVVITFAAVSGTNINDYSSLAYQIKESVQKTNLQVLNNIREKCPEAWSQLAEQDFFFEKNKKCHQRLLNLFETDSSLISQILFSMCKHSQKIDNWFFKDMLDLTKIKKYSELVTELINLNSSNVIQKLEMLQQFLNKEVKRLSQVPFPSRQVFDFESLVQFIQIFSATINSDPEENVLKKANFDLDFSEIENLMQVYHNFRSLSKNSIQVIKLIIFYVFGSSSLTKKEPNSPTKLLEFIYSTYKKGEGFDLLGILSLIGVGSKQANKWLNDHIDSLFDEICQIIPKTPLNLFKGLTPLFVFLNNIVTIDVIRKKFVQNSWHIQLLSLFTVSDPSSQQIFKSNDPELLSLLCTFIKEVTIDFPDQEETLAKFLTEKLSNLGMYKDKAFLAHFFFPLLKSQSSVPVCLLPYNKAKNQLVHNLKPITASANNKIDLEAPFLSGQNAEAFIKAFEKIADHENNLPEYIGKKWEKSQEFSFGMDHKALTELHEKLTNPFVILLEGISLNYAPIGGSMDPIPTIAGIFIGSIPSEDGEVPKTRIPLQKDAFFFYYRKGKAYHFPVYSIDEKVTLLLNFQQPGNASIQIKLSEISTLMFNFPNFSASHLSFNTFSMISLEGFQHQSGLLALNNPTKAEIWVLKNTYKKKEKLVKDSHNIFKDSNVIYYDLFNEHDPLNYYRSMPVYKVPAAVPIEYLSNCFFDKKVLLTLKTTQEELKDTVLLSELHDFVGKDSQQHGIIDIEFDYEEYEKSKQSETALQKSKIHYFGTMVILNAFRSQGGIDAMITIALNNAKNYKEDSLEVKWINWINELKSFIHLPGFLEAIIQDQEAVSLLNEILTKGSEEDLQEEEEKTQYVPLECIYRAFAESESFRIGNLKGADQITKTLSEMLHTLAVLTKAKARHWVEDPEKEEKNETPLTPSPTKNNNEKKSGKKKGVGYGSDYNSFGGGFGGGFQPLPPFGVAKPGKTSANPAVDQFMEKKRIQNEKIISLISGISELLKRVDWEPQVDLYRLVCESALLPILEAAFRNGSLVEMGKEIKLYYAYLRLVKAISTHKVLVPCLLELEKNYIPKQRESVFSLLTNVKDAAKLFLSCLSSQPYLDDPIQALKSTAIMPPINNFSPIPPLGQAPAKGKDLDIAIKILKGMNPSDSPTLKKNMKEFIDRNAITAHNKELKYDVPEQTGGLLVTSPFGQEASIMPQVPKKKVIHKDDANVFNTKITQEKDASSIKKEEKPVNIKTKKDKAKPEEKKTSEVVEETKKDEVKELKEDEDQSNEGLAKSIINTFEFVQKEVVTFRKNQVDEEAFEDLLRKPLPEAYKTFLGPLKFDYMEVPLDSSQFGYYGGPTVPGKTKMIRLAQELADLTHSLPEEHTNAIFIRVDKTKIDKMRVVIMGSSGTPYAHGAFEYDVYFDDSYPNAPPKVNLVTTGGGQVRFNPNLYANGKVCLSLLGTWAGQGGENWDPKLSTILQVLLSIQSLIMTEDIYFNEPGLEVHAGTSHGELENEGYSNVVRYCNIKYAMIEQIRRPSKGFEEVIKRHFYFKKDEILKEAKQWIELAKTKNASYSGCQNYNWQAAFNQGKNKYAEMLDAIVKELEEELNKIPPPTDIESGNNVQVKRVRKAKQQKVEEKKPLEEIDVTYDKDIKAKDLDVTDDAVKDRWSRYIGAMGIEAVKKQANSSVFLSGLGPLGVEIAKNITLSGVKRLTLHDAKKATLNELSGQFFLEEEDVGKNRVSASLNKLQQLNFYVKIDTAKLDESLPKEEAELEKIGLKDYNLVIATESDREILEALDRFCRKRGIAFIAADIYGPFSRIFCDFGDEFVVTDKDGEEAREVLIKSITNEEQGLITLLETNKHNFEDGDEILITEVVGMEETSGKGSINQSKHKVKVQNAYSFRIGETRNYSAYQHNGKVKIIKNPIIMNFKSLEEATRTPATSLDQNLALSDFTKTSNSTITHVLFEALEETRKESGRLPRAWNQEDSTKFTQVVESTIKKIGSDVEFNEETKKLAQLFALTCSGVFGPLAAFIGGFVAQEAVKALTNKFKPINQFFYSDCSEIIPPQLLNTEKPIQLVQKGDRYDGLRICVGDDLFLKLSQIKIFMVGVGAIGCELLKNFAMIGLGSASNGEITITDPDVIETSNLNRQFLFREKHLRKPKSSTAAASIVQMNKDLKGKIHARLDKVHPGTAHIFTDKFFEGVDIVANALDNVPARRYIDMRCVKAKTPLLESGTLGPKGHVQVIVPYKTESYGSQEDPQDEHDIPHCTLKMFPEETLHCVEWARDKFGKLFTQKPKSLVKLLEDPDYNPTNMQELETLKHAVKLLKKMPTNFDDCVRYARHKFQKYFVNDIRQLLFTYPLDQKTKQGTPFWASPKRPPAEVLLDASNLLHASFISACAILWANIFGIPVPKDASKDQTKLKIAKEALEIKVKDFKPSSDKAKELATEVELEEKKQVKADEVEEKAKEKEETTEQFVHTNEFEVYKKEFQSLVAALPKDMEERVKSIIFPQEFEKDNDKNFHIEFIYALANCRASNYKLEPMDWMTVKLKAGRIVPALATTTASIAGLQTIELCKVVNQNKIEDVKNAFLNFAVPYLTLSEPGPAQKVKLTEKLTVTLWDRWEITLNRKAGLKDLFSQVLKDYELQCLDVMFEGKAIYLHNIMEFQGREAEKEKMLNQDLVSLLDLDDDAAYVDLTVTFSRVGDKQILDNTPEVRVIFS